MCTAPPRIIKSNHNRQYSRCVISRNYWENLTQSSYQEDLPLYYRYTGLQNIILQTYRDHCSKPSHQISTSCYQQITSYRNTDTLLNARASRAGCSPDFTPDTLSLHYLDIWIEGNCFSSDAKVGQQFVSSSLFFVPLKNIFPGLFWCVLLVPAIPDYLSMFFNENICNCVGPRYLVSNSLSELHYTLKGYRQGKKHGPVSSRTGLTRHHLNHTGGEPVVSGPRLLRLLLLCNTSFEFVYSTIKIQ